MADSSIFFQTSDPLGLSSLKWRVQDDGNTVTEQNAVALGEDGDKIAEQAYDAKTEITATYITVETSNTGTNGATVPTIGDVLNGYHIDNVQVKWTQTDWPKMTVTAHKHGSANHDAPSHKYAPTIGKVGGFGCPTSIGPFTLGSASGVGVKSVSYTLQASHVDEPGSTGDHLAGDNYDGTEQVTVETTGPFTFSAGTDGWHKDSAATNKSNTAATSTSGQYTKHLTKAAATTTTT